MSIETIHTTTEIDVMFNKIANESNIDENLNILNKAKKCRLIRNFNYDFLYSKKYPETYKSIIQTDSPMLCLRMKSLDQSDQTTLWKSNDYIADEKIDGLRCFLAYNKEYNSNNGYELFSRENDEETLLPKSITNLLIKNINKPNEFYKSFLLDCELVIKDSNYSFLKVFDCLNYNNNSIIEEPWYFRRYTSEKIVESINDKFISMTSYVKNNKIDFYNKIKQTGGEGVVIKNINSKYSTKGTRSKYSWIKVKGNVFDYSIIEDTLEGYVSETSSNSETVSLSAFINNNEISQKIAIIPLTMFNYVKQSSVFKNKIDLGSVVEFSSSFYSYKDNLFKNTFPIKIRMDKTIKDCFYSVKDINRWSA